MTKSEKAKELFESGFNCAQAVFLAFREEMRIDEETAIRLVAGFGGGFGRMREVCGAVSGMVAVISYFNACTDPKNHEKKMELYSKIQSAMNEYKEINGSYICRELLGLEGASNPSPEKRTDEYYKKRPCGELCAIAAGIAEKYVR